MIGSLAAAATLAAGHGGAMDGQRWDVEGYRRFADFVPELGRPLLALLAPRPGERVLDLGCGDGALTAEIAAAGSRVTGIDSAPQMVAAARRRGLDAREMDAAALTFERAFDAIFSNAVLHWVADIDATLAGVARALRPGGRFVGEFGGHGNVAAIRVALAAVLKARGAAPVTAWFYPTPQQWRRRLQAAGFAVRSVELLPRPTPLPAGMAGWLETFAGRSFAALPPGERLAARDEALALLAPVLRDSDGHWSADYMRLRFAARLERAEGPPPS